MSTQEYDQSPEDFDPYNNALGSLSKSKLDKNQARRLKMPKRNRSAYFLFSMEIRLKLKNESKEQLTPLETQAKVSQYWKELSADEREKFEQRAREEKQEYIAAMDKFYSNLTPETIEKSKSNRPKKPCSAYAHFVRDIKIKLKEENPKLIMQEILHIVSEKWRNLDRESRSVYEERAEKDKQEYMAQIKKINAENAEVPKKKKQAADKRKKSEEVENDWENELPVNKQLKGDLIPAKIVKNKIIQGVSPTMYNRQDTNKDISTMSTGSMESKSTSEGSHDLSEKIKPIVISRPLICDPKFIEKPSALESIPAIEIPKLDHSFLIKGNQVPPGTEDNLLINLELNKMRELMMARLSMAKLAEANRSMEETLMRKILEVKTIQTQRLLMARNILLSSNNGCF